MDGVPKVPIDVTLRAWNFVGFALRFPLRLPLERPLVLPFPLALPNAVPFTEKEGLLGLEPRMPDADVLLDPDDELEFDRVVKFKRVVF